MWNKWFRVTNAAVSAIALTVLGAAGANAKGHNAGNVVPDDGWRIAAAKTSLVDVRDLAQSALADATSFEATIRTSRLTDLVLERQQLNQIRSAVNEMGRHVTALDADRANLATWETAALDQVIPVLQRTASTLSSAIQYSKDNPTWVGSPANRDFALALEKDLDQIHKTVDDYLHLDKSQQAVRRAEQHLPVAAPAAATNN